MDQLSTIVLMKALDGLSMRSVAIAENIANAGTRGYRPVRVRFEEALAAAAAQGPDAVEKVEPRLERMAIADSLRTDLELGSAVTTQQRYSALIELLNRELQLDALAIRGS